MPFPVTPGDEVADKVVDSGKTMPKLIKMLPKLKKNVHDYIHAS